MSVFTYLQLQTVDPQDDGTTSDLDVYEHDETIDLTEETEGAEIMQAWTVLEKDMHESAGKRSKA